MSEKAYAAIDLKSFYASVECAERGLDPLTTNLVVADSSRTEKTICLAVSPSLKAHGIPGRPRLFEVNEKVREINAERRLKAPGKKLTDDTFFDPELNVNPALALGFIIAPPRMAKYIEYSTTIYGIYLKYVAPEDIFAYSIDEVFIDLTGYLKTYGKTPRELVQTMIRDVLDNTGITATAGIGTNLYLAKIAMDIEAKHIRPDGDGVRIAELDEQSYREKLWDHRPMTDFWRIGRGTTQRLEKIGVYTMGDLARCSIKNEDLLYSAFGVNAELLIDHAWGWEPCTMEAIKAYKPETNSLSSGQVLSCGYSFEKTLLVIREMAHSVALDLVRKKLVTDQIVLDISYDAENLTDPERAAKYRGAVSIDGYGRRVPKSVHGSITFDRHTSADSIITNAAVDLFKKISAPELLVKRINLCVNRVLSENSEKIKTADEQLTLFSETDGENEKKEAEEEALLREKRRQQAILSIQSKFGKNAILKGIDLEEGATTVERNGQIGGHKA